MGTNTKLGTQGPASLILIRLLVGGVFITEGLQKLLFPGILGASRFAELGFPVPRTTATAVGVIEVVAGGAVLVGLATRLAAVFLLLIALGAIITTKIPILLGHGIWVFPVQDNVSRYGVWGFFHEWRGDIAMLLGSLYLLIAID
ncbi:DoxX family protein [Halocatena pleomorpha]|uniref:DoxX family protein n=1 Tax=Halocatena pleomorpha TaxID=1785090 RepID=A0A3P3RDI0_9EURY|nr:DoxX family protein [Halocatena pleomorpha]RRJ30513.1 DoxX family protein [Halocatena pleomorpha]